MMKIDCLARAYGDKPLARYALGEGDGLVYLSNPSIDAPDDVLALKAVGFPRRCVFRFDDSLLAALSRAHASSDTQALEELWARAVALDASLPAMDKVMEEVGAH